MQFKTNLATRAYVNRKHLNIAMAAALTLLLILFFLQLRLVLHNTAEIKHLSSVQASLEARSKKQGIVFSGSDYTKLLADIKFANTIIHRKTYDWIGLLNKLENVIPQGVTLSSVSPDTKQRTLKISGLSLNFGHIRQFMENLEDSNFFSDVYLEKQDESKATDDRKVISFSITCKFAS
jgi:type IV pilus assembly protein PilN